MGSPEQPALTKIGHQKPELEQDSNPPGSTKQTPDFPSESQVFFGCRKLRHQRCYANAWQRLPVSQRTYQSPTPTRYPAPSPQPWREYEYARPPPRNPQADESQQQKQQRSQQQARVADNGIEPAGDR